MKKILAALLATATAVSMAPMAFAATTLTPTTGTSSGDYKIDFSNTSHGNKAEWSGMPILHNYGDTDEVTVDLMNVANVEKIRVDVSEGNVKASIKKNSSYNGTTNQNYGTITIKADAGLRDFDEDEWTVDVDVEMDEDLTNDNDYTFYITGDVSYSNMREVSEDEQYSNKDTDTEGCMYNFDSNLDEETRIRTNEYVDVYFKGNYGTDKENMRVWTDTIDEVESFFDDVDLNYYDFQATPKFATKVKVVIDADPNSYVYEYSKSTGDLTRIDAAYESDGWAFTTKTLGCYIITEEEYEDGNVSGSTSSEDEETDSDVTTDTPVKTNPGTGYGN